MRYGNIGKDQELQRMKHFTDWNCGLLPNGLELLGKARDAALGLRILSERTGISRFCFLPAFDPHEESLVTFLQRRDDAVHALSPLLPADFRLIPSARILLPSNGILPDDPKLKKLCIPKTNCLPVTFFLWDSPIAVENRIAGLVHHSAYSILLPSAERILSIFPKDVSERIFRLPNVTYQFSYASLADEQTRGLLRHLMNRKAHVLFGSSVQTPAEAARFDLPYYLEIAKNHFNSIEYETLFFSDRLILQK